MGRAGARARSSTSRSKRATTSSNRGFTIPGSFWHLKGFEVKNAGDNCINISGSNNTVEWVEADGCDDTGIQITASGAGTASNNLILNCDAHDNFDTATGGENADGIDAKLNIGPGNVFRGCRSWNNADDGYDLFGVTQVVTIDGCWAMANGQTSTGMRGVNADGNGFKLGGNGVPAVHVVTDSFSMGNRTCGYTLNNNTATPNVSDSGALGNNPDTCSITLPQSRHHHHDRRPGHRRPARRERQSAAGAVNVAPIDTDPTLNCRDEGPLAGRDGDRARRAARRFRAPTAPFTTRRPITEADVAGRSLRELAILRNTIFARAGQPFRKRWLHEYFAAQPWYKVKGVVDPHTLSAVDQKNAEFLSRHELALPRADLERSLDALLARHVYGQFTVGRRVVAFLPDGNEVWLGEGSQIKRVDLLRGKTTIIPENSFGWNDDIGGLGLVAGARKIIAFTNMHLEVNDLGASGREPTPASNGTRSTTRGHTSAVGTSIGRAAQCSRPTDGASLPARRSSTRDGDDGEDVTRSTSATWSPSIFPTPRSSSASQSTGDDDHPCFALSPDGTRAIVSAGGEVSLWDLASEKVVWTHSRGDVRPHASKKAADANRCWEVAFSADARWALEAAAARSTLFDVKTGRVVRTLALPFGTALAFSPDGTQLLAGGPCSHRGCPLARALGRRARRAGARAGRSRRDPRRCLVPRR